MFCRSAAYLEKYLAWGLKKKKKPSVQSYVDMNMLSTHAVSKAHSDMQWGWGVGGGASPSNSRNNIILPFTVARMIDEDEERLSCGSLHQPVYVPAALVK